MKKIIVLLLFVLGFVSFADETLFRLEMKEDKLAKIAVRKNYVLQTVDGKPCLYLRGPKAFEFKLPDELAQFEGEHLRITYRYRLKDVPEPEKPHLGFKVMGSYKYDGKSHVGHAVCPCGTKDWTWEGFNFLIQKDAKNLKLSVVLPGKGEAWVSDVTVSYRNKK